MNSDDPDQAHRAAVEQEVRRLAADWERLRNQQFHMSSGCGCGAPVTSMAGADYERSILDYLIARHMTGTGAIHEILGTDSASQSLAVVISSLASHLRISDAAMPLLIDLRRSLDSLSQRLPGCIAAARPEEK